MYRKKAKLKLPLTFKEPGNPKTYSSRIGTTVHVDRHEFDEGMYIVWISSKRYALINSDVLISHIEFV
jgi:hypothetical protein